MAKLDTSGLHKAIENAKNLSGEISSDELFTVDFIQRYTEFDSWDEMCLASGIKSNEELKSDEFSNFVAENSEFSSLEEMWQKAGEEYMARQISS